MNKIKVNKQPIEMVQMSESEINMLVQQDKIPAEYIAVECCALGIQAIPQNAQIKKDDGSKIKCVPFALNIVVPIDAQQAFQTSLYISEQQQANGAIEKALPTPPIVRVILKKEFVSESFLKVDETIENENLFDSILSSAHQKPSEK